MLKRISLFAFLLTAGFGSLAADGGAPNTRWRITGEYLYLLPSVDDTSFVIDSDATGAHPIGTRKNNDFDFNSGYRVGAAYNFCECNRELFANYTYLGFNQTKNVSGDFLWATNGSADFTSNFENYAGSARSKLDFKYQRLDVLFGQQIHDCCGLTVSVQFGLEAVELHLKERYRYVSVDQGGTETGLFNYNSRAEAIGPQIGFAINYELYRNCGCLPGTLSLNVLSSGSLLAADNKVNVNNTRTGDTAELDVSNQKSWRVIPALHASIGLTYDMPLSCYDVSFGVGYEFSSYIRGLTRVSFPDDVADSLSYNNYYNFDVQGLYVSASFGF